jgi:hypothetical protein
MISDGRERSYPQMGKLSRYYPSCITGNSKLPICSLTTYSFCLLSSDLHFSTLFVKYWSLTNQLNEEVSFREANRSSAGQDIPII